jgi:hypothetical protein
LSIEYYERVVGYMRPTRKYALVTIKERAIDRELRKVAKSRIGTGLSQVAHVETVSTESTVVPPQQFDIFAKRVAQLGPSRPIEILKVRPHVRYILGSLTLKRLCQEVQCFQDL